MDLTYQQNVSSEELPGRAYPRLPDSVSPQDFGSQVGQGLEQAGEIGQQIHERTQSIVRQTVVENAHNQLLQLHDQLLTDPNSGAYTLQGQNAFGLDQKYLPAFDQKAAQVVGSISDPRAQQAATLMAAQVRTSLQERLDSHEITQHNDFADQTSANSVALAQKQSGMNVGHQDIYDKSRAQIDDSLEAVANRKGWSPEELQEQKLKAYTGQNEAVVKGYIANGDVSGATDFLYSHMAEMDGSTAESLQRMTLNATSQAESLQARTLKLGSDQLYKNGLDLIEAGKLTPQWVHDNRDLLEPSAYKYFHDVLSGKDEAAGDPRTYANLFVRSGHGEDVSDDATKALESGRITRAEFSQIVGKVQSERPGGFKRGVMFIGDTLKPGPLNPLPNPYGTQAMALADYNDWASDPKNKDATAEDYIKQAQAISGRYSTIDHNATTLLLPAPRFLQGTRIQPDLAATARLTKEALARGDITQDQYVQQARLIAQYASSLNAQAKAAEQQKQKQKANAQ